MRQTLEEAVFPFEERDNRSMRRAEDNFTKITESFQSKEINITGKLCCVFYSDNKKAIYLVSLDTPKVVVEVSNPQRKGDGGYVFWFDPNNSIISNEYALAGGILESGQFKVANIIWDIQVLVVDLFKIGVNSI